MTARLARVMTTSEPSRPVAVARIMVGAAAIAKAAYYAVNVLPRLGPDVVRRPWFEGLPALSAGGFGLVLVIWLAAAVAFLVGLRTRLAGAVLVVCAGTVLMADRQLYSNHLYLLLTLVLLLTIARSADALSLDAKRGGGSARVPGWPVFLLRLQLTIVYLFAAVSKVNLDFISGSVIFLNWRNGGAIPLPPYLARLDVMVVLATLVILGELFVAIGFWSPRLVRSSIVVGVLLHAGMVLTTGGVWELSIFAALMFSMYGLFPTKEAPTTAEDPQNAFSGRPIAALYGQG